eukprot:Phypoly_transcript_07294.p1 GENE.Phypoly_transcript_07294~~Phypoly_transcript_07294.p1  ORF type:complete len:412 (+),score=28.71 Phypoly_transcript_07294:80-1315(+)
MKLALCGSIFCVLLALLSIFAHQTRVFTPTTIYPSIHKGLAHNSSLTAVVVIGASFSGLTIASELALHGYKVIVISAMKSSKKLTGGCTMRGPATVQMARAFNVSADRMADILTDANTYPRFYEYGLTTGEVLDSGNTVKFDYPFNKLGPAAPSIVSGRHSDFLKRVQGFLKLRGDIQFIDQAISDIKDLDEIEELTRYKQKAVINATPNLKLLNHPLPPTFASLFALHTQVPCKGIPGKNSTFLNQNNKGLIAFINFGKYQQKYVLIATAFADSEYPESDYYMVVSTPPIPFASVQELKENITVLSQEIASTLELEFVDPTNSLFVGSTPVHNGNDPVSSYFHKSPDKSTIYITASIAGMYGAQAINGDGILAQVTTARVISKSIIEGRVFSSKGDEYLHMDITSGAYKD